ncbi:hypothetical protein M959_12637, partial [Chaetura pelagica]
RKKNKQKTKKQNQPNQNQSQGGESSTGECSLEFKPYTPVPFLCPTFCDA